MHLAVHHPQPPKHQQGHQTMCPWVSLQESHPTSLPTPNSSLTISSLPSLPGALGPELKRPSALCPSASRSAKREAAEIKKCWDTGKMTKVIRWRFLWSARGAKEGFRQDFGLWQCWSLWTSQWGRFSSALHVWGLGKWSQPGHDVVQTTWSVHLKPVCSPR